MAHKGGLLVKLNVGHSSQLLQPPLPNGHTHRWTVYVKTTSNEDFKDRSFVEKVCFHLHPDFPNSKRLVKEPPYQVTETGYAGFPLPLTIQLAGKQYKVQYDLNLTMEKHANYHTLMTISVADYTPEFYSMARKFGADRLKRSRERELLGLPDGSSASSSGSPPPEKIRKKERSADVSARNSPTPIERLKIRVEEKERDLRKAESSISPANREKTASSDHKEKKKKENKLLDFVLDKSRPSPSPSPAVVEKLKRDEKSSKKEVGKSSSPSASAAAVEKLKREERKKDVRGSSSPSTSTAAVERMKEERRKEKIVLQSSEKDKKKEKNGITPSPPEKEKRKEKDDRLASVAAEKKKGDKEREKEKRKEKEPSLPVDSTVSKREKEKKEEKGKKDKKDRDRSKEFRPPSSSSDRDKTEKERKELPSSITPPPVLLRQECTPSVSAASTGRSASPPTLVPIGNGRATASYAYGAATSTVAGQQSIGAIPSLLTSNFPPIPPSQLAACSTSGSHALSQPSPSGSQGGRETPSEKASRSSISPGLRNEETASSGGSSTSSYSSERRAEQKRIPKVAPSKGEREALSAPLVSVDASTVRRRIDSLTDPDTVFEVALLLLDLDPSSSVITSKNAPPSLSYDLSTLDQKELLRLDSVLNGGGSS